MLGSTQWPEMDEGAGGTADWLLHQRRRQAGPPVTNPHREPTAAQRHQDIEQPVAVDLLITEARNRDLQHLPKDDQAAHQDQRLRPPAQDSPGQGVDGVGPTRLLMLSV
jgi:hypothetical protein